MIRQANNVKILRITFDIKLTWKNHITKLKQDCANRLSSLKITATKNWGADQPVKNTYQANIRAKLDYGAVITQFCIKLSSQTIGQNAAIRSKQL